MLLNAYIMELTYISARLRIKNPADRKDRVEALLKELHLDACADVLVGSSEIRGVSGGQRKRVNIALELLTNPSVLFVDEPTR